MAKVKRVLSLYPSERAYLIVGYHIPALNAAVERWAHFMANGLRYNEDTFSRCEWCAICEAHDGTLFEATADPQEVLANKLEDPACAYLEEKWNVCIGHITARLREMRPLEAWAVVHVVQFFWRELKHIDWDNTKFWELETIMQTNAQRLFKRENYYEKKLSRRNKK